MAKVSDIEGVGESFAKKLESAGVTSIKRLLEKGGTKTGREALASAAGISEKLVLRWVNHADLMRLFGVGPQYAELLEAVGVDSVPELAQRNADNLLKALVETNAARKISGTTPAPKQVRRWVTKAASLERKVHH